MDKTYYIVTFKQAYFDRFSAAGDEPDLREEQAGRLIVGMTHGGFGQDVVDEVQQVKERFLEYLFSFEGIDLPRTSEVFDAYFGLDRGEVIDLDEEI